MVRFPDGTVLHCEYNGTSDVMVSALWDTREQMLAHCRGEVWNVCMCGCDEPVTLFSDYGSPFHWPGRACRRCRAITAGQVPFLSDDPITDEEPDWVKLAKEATRNG